MAVTDRLPNQKAIKGIAMFRMPGKSMIGSHGFGGKGRFPQTQLLPGSGNLFRPSGRQFQFSQAVFQTDFPVAQRTDQNRIPRVFQNSPATGTQPLRIKQSPKQRMGVKKPRHRFPKTPLRSFPSSGTGALPVPPKAKKAPARRGTDSASSRGTTGERRTTWPGGSPATICKLN